MNLDPAQASRLVRNAVQGEAATQFSDLDRKLDVRVRATEDERSRVAQLAEPRGRPQRGPARAARRGRRRRGRARPERDPPHRPAARRGRVARTSKDRDLGSAVARHRGAPGRARRCRPARASTLAGQNRELAESFGSLRFALLLAVFLVYLVMASQFESLLHPFVIMFSIPLGARRRGRSRWSSTGTSISVMVLIGLVILAGIVVNNAIVLVDCANQLRREGRSKLDALVEAGQRPHAPDPHDHADDACSASLPMALGFGEGAEVRAPARDHADRRARSSRRCSRWSCIPGRLRHARPRRGPEPAR